MRHRGLSTPEQSVFSCLSQTNDDSTVPRAVRSGLLVPVGGAEAGPDAAGAAVQVREIKIESGKI